MHQRIQFLGTAVVPIYSASGKPINCEFHISEDSSYSLIGLKVIHELGVSVCLLLPSSTTSHEEINKLLTTCDNATGGMTIDPIYLEAEGDPIFFKGRILPYGLREPVHKELMKLQNEGTISAVNSSVWTTPIVTPLKKDGITPRICGDYRMTVNKVLKNYISTTEETEDLLNRLESSKVFSVIDLRNAFLQVPLDEASKQLTTISTPYGLFEYNFLPFGLSAAPAIFQKVVDEIIDGLPGVLAYQDDLIVHGMNSAEHSKNLRSLLLRLVEKNVRINGAKCKIAQTSIPFLGFTIDASGIHPNRKCMSAWVESKSPTNFAELRSITSALQYYSRLVAVETNRACP